MSSRSRRFGDSVFAVPAPEMGEAVEEILPRGAPSEVTGSTCCKWWDASTSPADRKYVSSCAVGQGEEVGWWMERLGRNELYGMK